MTDRKPAGLNFGDFDDISVPNIPNSPESKAIEQVSQKEGFTSRQPKPSTGKIDGRTLRNSPRKTQLNMNVQSETKERFWQLAKRLNLSLGDDLLIMLMDNFEKDG